MASVRGMLAKKMLARRPRKKVSEASLSGTVPADRPVPSSMAASFKCNEASPRRPMFAPLMVSRYVAQFAACYSCCRSKCSKRRHRKTSISNHWRVHVIGAGVMGADIAGMVCGLRHAGIAAGFVHQRRSRQGHQAAQGTSCSSARFRTKALRAAAEERALLLIPKARARVASRRGHRSDCREARGEADSYSAILRPSLKPGAQ